MDNMPGECFHPPHVKYLKVLEAGDSFAAIHWYTSSYRIQQMHKYSYQLNWKLQGPGKMSSRVSSSASSRLVLPSSQQSIVLANLRPLSNYSLSVFSFNQCAKSPTISVKVSTRHSGRVHQAVTRLLPIEMLLIAVVLLIWVWILYHFLRLYKKITLVNAKPMGIFTSGHKKNSRTSDASRLSNASAASRTSNINQFDLLEDAVCAWRSETVLSRKFPRDPRYPANESRENTTISEILPKRTYSRSAKTSINSIRRFSRASLAAPMLSVDNFHPGSHSSRHLALNIPAYQPIPQVTINDNNAESLAAKGMIHASPSLPTLRRLNVHQKTLSKLPSDEAKKAEQTNVENQGTTSAILSQRRVSTNPYALISPEGGPSKRKISQVVLGKATKDIRRRSSFGSTNPTSLHFVGKLSAKRTSLKRRLSNINITLQKKFSLKGRSRRKVEKMGSLREGENENSSGEEGSSPKQCLASRQCSTSSITHPNQPQSSTQVEEDMLEQHKISKAYDNWER